MNNTLPMKIQTLQITRIKKSSDVKGMYVIEIKTSIKDFE